MKRKLISSFSFMLLSSGMFFIFNFMIAKTLGASIYGEITFYLSFSQIFVLFIGINHPALYMGTHILQEDEETLSLFVSIQTLFLAISIMPAFWLIRLFVHDSIITGMILVIAYLLVNANTIGLAYNARKDVASSIFYSTLLPRILLIAFFTLAMALGYGNATTYLFVYAGALLIAVGYVFLRYKPHWRFEKTIFSRLWKFYLLGLIGASFTYIAQILQKEYGGYEELASLGIALLIISGLEMVGRVLIKFALPKIHEIWKRKDIPLLQEIYTTSTFIEGMVNVPILAFLYLYMKDITIFFGEGYYALPSMFTILSVGYFFDLMTGVTGTILRATEHEHLEIYNEIVRFVVGIGLIIMFRHQMYGIAYAISASMVTYNVAKFFQLYRLFGIMPMQWNHFKMLFGSLSILVISLYVLRLVMTGWQSFAIAIVALVIYYALSYKVFRKFVNFGVYR